VTTHSPWGKTLIRFLCGLAVLRRGLQNAAIHKANYERVHAKVKESTKKQ